MKPKILGIPALGAIGYLGAFVIVLYVFYKTHFSRNNRSLRQRQPEAWENML